MKELLKRSKVRVSSDVDERILGDVMERADRSRLGIWRRIVRSEWGRLGLVTGLVVALVLVAYWYGSSAEAKDVSWAAVASNIGKAEAVSYRMRMSKRPAGLIVVYESEAEVSDGPTGDVQIGEYLEAKRNQVVVGIGQRGRTGGGRRLRAPVGLDVPRGEFTEMAKKTLAKGIAKRFLSAGGRKLPSQKTRLGWVELIEVIDVEALGFENGGVKSGIGWLTVDAGSNLPVMVELEIDFEDGARTRVWLDKFEWDFEK
ncbi:MAG: hypothetical protein JSV99_05160 [Planctomycetota bacterium]|nr:MAG: hypothetical protein JSV99_05160 [Planctomycetota bacterium]